MNEDYADAVEVELMKLALAGHPPRTCSTTTCKDRKVEPRFATRAEQIELTTGRVPTVIWHCDGCNVTRKEMHR